MHALRIRFQLKFIIIFSCAESNLNGIYYAENPSSHQSTGILWEPWLGDYSLKSTVMMIRPRDVWATDDENSSQPQDP